MIGAPLRVALYCGHLDIARLLLEHGADATAQDDNKLTPLRLASICRHLEISQLVFECGAETEVKDTHGLSPLL
jgi:ankyrin repeat protein